MFPLSGDLDAIKEQAWCNFEFLLARLHSSSVHALLSDLDFTLASVLDADIHLVLQAIVASTRVLVTDALQLASELIGRLRQLKGHISFYLRASYAASQYCFCRLLSVSLSVCRKSRKLLVGN